MSKAKGQKPSVKKRKKITEFLVLNEEVDKVTVRLPIELNDWLDERLKQGKRQHGHKIPKEVWVQAAIELLKAMPVDWYEIDSIEQMRERLIFLENKCQNLDSGQ
jgi:hypothetical protein